MEKPFTIIFFECLRYSTQTTASKTEKTDLLVLFLKGLEYPTRFTIEENKEGNETDIYFYLPQWEALALLLIGISVNQLRSLPEGASNLGVSVTMGAYVYTLIFVSESCFMARMLAPTYIQASSSPWFLNIFKQLESLLQVTVPSLASVYNEYALKSQYDTSIYLQVILPLCCVKLNLEDKLRCLNRYVFVSHVFCLEK